jgi:hypothetical protein
MLEYTETVTIERNYYFEIAGEKVPNEEDMLAFLLDEGILFSGNDYGDGTINLYINVNDYFAPASDAESLPHKDIPKLFEMYKENNGYDGVFQYVADKRGIPNKKWKE